MATQQKQWGMTAPISTALPTAEDIASNEALIEELKRQNNFESREETDRRVAALAHLQKVTEEFVKHVMTKKGKFSQAAIKSAGGKIFTFGSYRLGVYSSGSDIDTLIIAPKDVTREDFFECFPKILEQLSPAGAIGEVTPVPDAFVPIIKLEYSGVDIDLLFASLNMSSVPRDMADLKDNNILRGLDDRAQKSVNGTRVTDEILELVPQEPIFRTALRTVKLWAQRRAIYANIMGFPGGVAWAILVARVCQLYPQATSSRIVAKFFWMINRWPWPEAVYLKSPEGNIPGIQAQIWNPNKNRRDTFHLMPVITPAFPSMCATHNISKSTKSVVLKELARAFAICEEIAIGKAQWKDLFIKHTFFTEDYKHYLAINSTSKTKEAQQLWSGTVESKVRLLVLELEKDEGIALAHPFNKGFERVHKVPSVEQISEVTEGSLKYQVKEIETETTDATNDPRHKAAVDAGDIEIPLDVVNQDNLKANKVSSDGSATLYTTTYYVGLNFNQAAGVQLDLSYAISRFKEICTSWSSYKDDVNYVFVSHIRNFDLPEDIFKDGEKKPVRPKKKAARKANGEVNGPAARKRKANGEVNSPTAKKRNIEEGT